MEGKLRDGLATALISAVIVAGAVGLALAVGDSEPTSTASDDKYREVEYDSADAMLEDNAGSPLVVNFFASWCAPCRAELPDFAEAHAAYGDRVKFIGVNHADFSPEATSQLLIDTGIVYDIVKDPEGRFLQELGGLPAMPTTVCVDAGGNVGNRHRGNMLAEQSATNIQEIAP